MTKPIPVHIVMLRDRSGSMADMAGDVVGGYNQFLTEQKAKPGKCRLTLVQFDTWDSFEVVHDAVKLADVPPLDPHDFRPRGGTPLLDAEGRLMTHAHQRAQDRRRTGKTEEQVLFVTQTDGEENSSVEWTFEQVAAFKKAREAEGWAFLYLGIGHDGYKQAARVGTQACSTVSEPATAEGVGRTYAAYTMAASNVRDNAARGMRTSSAQLLDDEQAQSGNS